MPNIWDMLYSKMCIGERENSIRKQKQCRFINWGSDQRLTHSHWHMFIIRFSFIDARLWNSFLSWYFTDTTSGIYLHMISIDHILRPTSPAHDINSPHSLANFTFIFLCMIFRCARNHSVCTRLLCINDLCLFYLSLYDSRVCFTILCINDCV